MTLLSEIEDLQLSFQNFIKKICAALLVTVIRYAVLVISRKI